MAQDPAGLQAGAASAERAAPAAASRPRRAHLSRLRLSRFRQGLLCGIALLLGARYLLNHTGFADVLVRPLVHADTHGSADAIVVLGAGIVGPCEPNLHAMRRVMLAVRLWREQRAPILFFTGGAPTGLPCPVSQVMARLAVDLGVPPDRVHVETRSQNTHENAVASRPLLDSLGARRLLIVTDRLHMNRATGVFAQEGFAIERTGVPVYGAHENNVSMLESGGREYVALAYYRARGWIGSMDGQLPPSPAAAPTAGIAGGGAMAGEAGPRGSIVILGASYAGGWKPAPVAGLTFVNKGVAGQESWEMLARFDRDVVAERPRAVILWGFINDIHRAPKDRIGAAVTRARDSFVQMIAKARAAGIEPIVATEVTIRPIDSWSETVGAWVGWATGKTSYQDVVNGQVIETNAWLKDLAKREGLLVLDLLPVLSDDRGVRRKAFAKPDGSHITPEGYATLDAYARPILERHFAAR
jgi:uncharacterized SAM-binding protein YcdF (DUF218 family)/lysophospholipase L1-like esterase